MSIPGNVATNRHHVNRRRCLAVASLLAACMVVAACTSPGSPATPAQPAGRSLQALVDDRRICHAALAVIHARRVASVTTAGAGGDCLAASGEKDGRNPSPSGGPRPDPDAVFIAASLSKPVVAYAVLQLVDEGRLALDAPVMSYLPGGWQHRRKPLAASSPTDPANDPRLARITIRMLLDHTSGLPNWSEAPPTPSFEPGSGWQYSSEGYVLLQRAVEAATGEPLDRVVATRVFEPLGMTRSALAWDDRLASSYVPGRSADGRARAPRHFGVPVASTTLYTTAGDYARFVSALLDDRPRLAAIMASPVPVDERLGLSWGLGWGLENDGGRRTMFQWGDFPGYRALVMAVPASGDGFVLLTDSDEGLKIAPEVAARFLPGGHRLFDFRLVR
ncbi:MAG: serine hydrolase domain-containing protein [Burkholderiaceae bacterium]